MIKEHVQTLLILADRALKRGAIELHEMAAVAQAVEAAQKELNPQPAQSADNEQAIQNQTG